MTTTGHCPRIFEVEALRDGRLGGAERRSFERHLAACSDCARAAESLERLAATVRGATRDDDAADELHLWRERTRLLAAFDRALVSPNRTSRARRWLLWPTAVAALGAAIVIFWRARPAVEPVIASHAEIRADGSAVWSKYSGSGGREEIALERGVLRIRVDHASGHRGLVVRLPDGELEDVGTTFTVSADGGRTTQVAVEEGKVILRLRGQPAIVLGVGDVWLSHQPETTARLVEAAPPPGPARNRLPSPPPRSAPARRFHRGVAVAEPDPLVSFRVAMEALRTGDNRRAAAAFTSFLIEHPRDSRAEDAAYLRVIALQRTGDDEGMQRAAEEYIRRFPAGFRRSEVQRLSR